MQLPHMEEEDDRSNDRKWWMLHGHPWWVTSQRLHGGSGIGGLFMLDAASRCKGEMDTESRRQHFLRPDGHFCYCC